MRHFVIFFLLVVPTIAFAQIKESSIADYAKIGEVKSGGVIAVELSRVVIGVDTTYKLSYNNDKFGALVDYRIITFKEEGNTVNDLYIALATFFSKDNIKNTAFVNNFILGDEYVAVSRRDTAVPSITLWTPDGSFHLTEKQLNRLFGLGGSVDTGE